LQRISAGALLKNKYIAKGKKVKALSSFLDAHIKVDQATLADDDDYDSGDEDDRWVVPYRRSGGERAIPLPSGVIWKGCSGVNNLALPSPHKSKFFFLDLDGCR
jgi:hypothetical protein